jgi:Xaa-Pro dipeptidase
MSVTEPHPIRAQWARARHLMERQHLDALFVTEKYNYWLLTGHRSEQFDGKQRPMLLVLPLEREPAMIVYGRDERQVRATAPVQDIRTYVDVPFPLALVPQVFKDLKLDRATVGCELGEFQRLGLSYNDFMTIQRQLPGMKIADASAIFNQIRAVKAPWEIDRIRTACAMTTRAWGAALPQMRPGMDVSGVKMCVERAILETGGAVGHLEFGLEGHDFVHTYQRGDWLWSDLGINYQGYRSDLARMAVFGTPSDEHRRDFDRIWELLRRLMERIRPGVRCSDLTRQTSDDMVRMGLPPLEAGKRIGHGIGVTSDPPSISLADDTLLEPGMVLTPEPRFFIASGQRMHLEETVVVTDRGCELLSEGADRLVAID